MTKLVYQYFIRKANSSEDIDPEEDELEVIEDDGYDKVDTKKLKPISSLDSIEHKLIEAAQKVYNRWEQDANGKDYTGLDIGGGGICHLIADKFVDIISNVTEYVTTESADYMQHVYAIAAFQEGLYKIDIYPYTYETGGGFTWKKIPDIEFEVSDLTIEQLDRDPNEFYRRSQY
jgi:hypothetical protein